MEDMTLFSMKKPRVCKKMWIYEARI